MSQKTVDLVINIKRTNHWNESSTVQKSFRHGTIKGNRKREILMSESFIV